MELDQIIASFILVASGFSLAIWFQFEQVRIHGDLADSVFEKVDEGPDVRDPLAPSRRANRTWFRASLFAAVISAVYLFFSF